MSPKRIHVVHLVETLGIGGMENGLVNLANRFDYGTFDFSICCFTTPGPMAQRVTAAGAHVDALGFGAGWHLDAALALARRLRRSGADILHCHGWGDRSLIGLLAARLARTPRCLNGEHGGLHNLQTKRQYFLQRLIAPRFDGTVAVSEALKHKVAERLSLDPDTITVIPNGVDTTRFAGRASYPSARFDLGFGDDDWLIAVVGTLKAEKNQGVVIDAVAALPRDARYHVLFAGDGPDAAALRAQAQSHGLSASVHFLGRRDDVPQLLSAADVLVLPSVPEHEGMSNALLEAMASGVPVVTSDSVGARELVESGRTGLLFRHSDAQELAGQLERLRSNDALRTAMASRAREMVRASYSLDTMVSRYQDFYRDILGRSPVNSGGTGVEATPTRRPRG